MLYENIEIINNYAQKLIAQSIFESTKIFR